MAFIIKPLGKANVTASGTATLYTVPAGKSALVNNIRMVNGHTTAATPALNLFVKPSGAASLQMYNVNFTLPAKQLLVVEDVLTLGEGDIVQLSLGSTHTQGVACVLSGVENDQAGTIQFKWGSAPASGAASRALAAGVRRANRRIVWFGWTRPSSARGAPNYSRGGCAPRIGGRDAFHRVRDQISARPSGIFAAKSITHCGFNEIVF